LSRAVRVLAPAGDLHAGARLPRAIRRELERLAEWRGARDVEVRAAPDAWRAALARD
jgi:hypothetical protein